MFPVCPKCDVQLFGLEFKGIDVDFCPRCRGLWLDAGELEELLGATGAAASDPFLEFQSLPGVLPKGRACLCPRCDKPMHEIALASEPGAELKLDRCALGHGIWFDEQELRRLLAMFPARCAASRTIEYLNEALGAAVTTQKEKS